MGTRRTGKARKTRGATLALGVECTAREAARLKSRLSALLDRKSVVTLDASALRRVDTAGMQLLACFVRERRNQGRPLAWKGPAPALTEAARLLGLSDLFELMPA